MSRNDPIANPSRSCHSLLVAVLVAWAILCPPPAGAQPPGPPPGFHGMLVLGTQGKIYLLHLAMRSNPVHRFQLLLEVDFAAAGGIGDRTFVGDSDLASVPANEIYLRDRTHLDNSVSVYTLRPRESFVLTEIPRGERLSFRGDIVRGHFERDSEAPTLLENAVIVVRKILFFQDFRALDPAAPHPLDEGRLEMLLFGGDGEYFLTHRITLQGEPKEPGDNAFHQVFPVRAATAERLRFGTLGQAVPLTLEGSEATPLGRLPAAGGRFPARLDGLVEGVSTSLPLEIEVGPEHYLEVLL
jgi:hypothetical protein